MDRELAKQLLILVNDPHTMALLEKYISSRIERHHSDMETCVPEHLRGHQEAITELKRFKTLRNEVLGKAI